MGSNSSFIIVSVTLMLFLHLMSLRLIQGMGQSYDRVALDVFFQEYAQNTLSRRSHTGTLQNVPLLGNFSGMEVSVTRVRSSSFWARGVNFSHVDIPPRVIPQPFVRRLDIVYSNLGNWSSLYYNVPNYTFATPVLGFMTYASRNLSETNSTTALELSLIGNPIVVQFSHVPVVPEMRCVTFWKNETIDMSDVVITSDNVTTCVVRDQGHFLIAVPSTLPPTTSRRAHREKLWRWCVVGFGLGVAGLLLSSLIILMVIRFVRARKLAKMEKQSRKGETLDTTWVRSSRMPSAFGIRTQPVLENDYVP